MSFAFPQTALERTPELLIIRSARDLRCLSSAIVCGGLTTTRQVLLRHVDKCYDSREPVSEYRGYAAAHGIQGAFVGLMTAVWLRQAAVVTLAEGGLTVAAVVTAGTGNATAVGQSRPFDWAAGTINLCLLVDANLSCAALVNAVITATEAKTAVLAERHVRTGDGFAATGTSTDAVLVACPKRGPELPYAGPATLPGWLIGRCVRQGLEEALDAYQS